MKKTIFVTLLAAMMLFAFTACENSTSTDISKVVAYSATQLADYLANDSVKEITVVGELEISKNIDNPIVIDHAVTVKGADDDSAIVLNGVLEPSSECFITVTAENVVIDGIDITATGTAWGVINSRANNFAFRNGTITGNDFAMGILLDTNVTTGTVIENATITKTDRPVYSSAMVTDYKVSNVTFDGYIEMEKVADTVVVEGSNKTSDSEKAGIFVFTGTTFATTEEAAAAIARFKEANVNLSADLITSGEPASDPASSN